MAWPHSDHPARQRLRIELWSWSTWLVLCIISYPAMLVVLAAPRAGLLAALIAGGVFFLAASFGYTRRQHAEAWPASLLAAIAGGGAVSALAFAADRAETATSVLCGLALTAEVMFIWHFLPWLAQDAEAAETASEATFQLLPAPPRSLAPIRASLGLVVLLGFLVLGLGASWARGEKQVPDPLFWLIALALLSLGLMFVERMSFLHRSAQEGNLLMPSGCYRQWVGAGLLVLALGAALAVLAPWKPSPERAATRAGSQTARAPDAAPLLPTRLAQTAAATAAALQALAEAARSVHPAVLSLWLLLLLLLCALAVLWGFRRSRAARWLLWVIGWGWSLASRAWRRLIALLRALFPSPRPAPTAGATAAAAEPVNPLFDLFEHPELLDRLSPREVVVRTYHLLLSFAEMLGKGRRAGQTPFEYAGILSQAAPAAAGPLMSLTWAYAGAMYGGASTGLPEVAAVRQAWQRISGALTADLPPDDLALRRRAYLATRGLEHHR